MRLTTLLLSTLFSSSIALSALEINKPLPSVTISGDNGALISGEAFKSDTLKGKVRVIFYVDPDEKDLNEELTAALKAEKFDKKLYGTVAIINLGATWKPNFVIEKILASKQKEFPDTLYVKDKKKVLVEKWNVSDDNSNIIVIDKSGTVLYYHPGKVTNTLEVIDLIKKHM